VRPAVSLQDVAIHPDRTWPELFKIDNRSERSPNQTLDLRAAAIESALSKALFSLRPESFRGSGAQEALLPLRERTNKTKSRHTLKRGG
jgi:hypothetical protein